jgi:hypothetical protein
MPKNTSQLVVQGSAINVTSVDGEDYICLTNMVENVGGSAVIEKWFRNKNTIEFLGVWETLNNSNFNSPEFEGIKNQAGTNRFVLSVKQWIEATGAVGVRARAGRYGGTYAHRDIAFEFGAWVSPEFKLILVKEFQRLKQEELRLERWDYSRFLTKVNYQLQTSAVNENLVPLTNLPKGKHFLLYAEEADLVNIALFGLTARDWRKQNSELAKAGNIRDFATLEQLTVLSNLESLNSMYISQKVEKTKRFELLRAEALRQHRSLLAMRTPLHLPEEEPGR